MELAAAGKSVSPTSSSALASGIQLDMEFPWTRYKQFLKQPLMVGMGGFTLQYFCNDMNGAVQKQGYGAITVVPYIVMFSIMFAASMFWWVIDVRRVRLEACEGLETLPRHHQDILMNDTQQPAQDIQMNGTPQAEAVQTDQTLPGISDGDFPFEGRTQSAEAFSSIPARMSSQSAVVDNLTKTDEPIDKQGGGLSDKKGKEQNLTELQVRLLNELKERGPTRNLELAKIVGLVTGRDVNPSIYDLEKRNLVVKVKDTPPIWQLKEPKLDLTF